MRTAIVLLGLLSGCTQQPDALLVDARKTLRENVERSGHALLALRELYMASCEVQPQLVTEEACSKAFVAFEDARVAYEFLRTVAQ